MKLNVRIALVFTDLQHLQTMGGSGPFFFFIVNLLFYFDTLSFISLVENVRQQIPLLTSSLCIAHQSVQLMERN